MKKLLVILSAVLLLLSLCGCSSKEMSAEKLDNGGLLDDAEAFTVASAMVKEKLKAPSTAKFCLYTEATITHDKDVYTVKGWVDAQNSFGATLRSNWTVTFTAVKSGGKIGGENGKVTID